MLITLIKISMALTAWAFFLYTIFQVDYPNSLATANPYQLSYFFLPLFLGLTLTFSFKFNILSSGAIALGVIILLMLKAFESLNFVTVGLTLIATLLLFSSFKNISFNQKSKRATNIGLTSRPKKSKLTRKL